MEENKAAIEVVEKKAVEVTSEAVVNFSTSVEYQDENVEFFADTYNAMKQSVWNKVATKYPELNLDFLDEVWDPIAINAPTTGAPNPSATS